MKTNDKKHKAFAFLGAAFVLLIAMPFIGCNQATGSPSGSAAGSTGNSGGGTVTFAPAAPKPKHTVTFGVDGAGGTLKAKADGVAETDVSPITVEQGKTVTFTAEPAAGYKVKEWKVDDAVISNTSNSYTHSVTAAVNVKVSFETLPPGKAELTLSPGHFTIRVKATTADGSAIVVEGCTETTLTSGTETELHATGTVVTLKGKIIELYCGDYAYNGIQNKLTALNVQGLSALKTLNCGRNQLTALNVQGCTALKTLDCYSNRLTDLNVQGLSALQQLDCGWNQLTALDVQGLSALQQLDCGGGNQLTALDVQGLSALQELKCGGNRLTALDVQGLNALQGLSCFNNRLTALNVQGCTALQTLTCYSNQLTDLNVQGLNALQQLRCYDNQLTALDVQGLSALQGLWCYNNRLTALDVQGLGSLQRLYCSGNQLSTLNVQGLSALQQLSCGWNQLTALDVQSLGSLQILYCCGNQLTALDVQGLSALQELYCHGNRLSAETFTKIFTDLPTWTTSDGAKCQLYSEHVTEGNHTDFTTPSEVQAAFQNAKDVKHWRMYKVNTSGYEEGI